MKKTSNKDRGTDKKDLIKHSIKGAVLGLLMTMAFIFVFAALMLTGTFSEALKDTFILISVVLGAMVSGLYCAGRQGGGVIIAGLTSAAVYAILVLILSILFGKNSDEPTLTIRIVVAAVAGGCFGGVLKLHRKRKKSRLRR